MSEFTNKEIAKILNELADLLEIKGENKFKIRAYSNAARKLMNISEDINTLVKEDKLRDIKGIGRGIAETIKEIFEEGFSPVLEELRTELPGGVLELIEVPGLGPKSAHKLFYELEIQDIDDLREALLQKRVRSLNGFGPRREEKLLKSLKEYQQFQGLIRLDEALNRAEQIYSQIEMAAENTDIIKRYKIAGSLRRKKEMIGDIDILLETDSAQEAVDIIVGLPIVDKIIEQGEKKISFYTEEGLRVDCRLINKDSFAAALQYFTGSKEHNVRLRQRAKKYNFKLNEYGLFKIDEEEKRIKVQNESEIYKALDLKFIPPELREDRGEIKAAENDTLPRSVTLDDIKGDLHVHSRFSDGAYSIEEMLEAARKLDYEYLAITDHSQSLRVAHGMSAEKVVRQRKKIEKLREEFPDIYIINGIEVDILKDGTLDYCNEILSGFELVIASVHTGFKLSEEEMTERIIKAMESSYVDILGHPQGRILGRRTAYNVDMNKVINAAARTNTCLEINASPNRLDLDDKTVYQAKKAGLKMAICTDSHHIKQLNDMELGVSVARRGWLEKDDILNTMSLSDLKDFLAKKKR